MDEALHAATHDLGGFAPHWQRQCSVCKKMVDPQSLVTCSSQCGAMVYCGEGCREEDWRGQRGLEAHRHELWCQRLQTYMAATPVLADLPFTFAPETTAPDFHPGQYRNFLNRQGVYNQGLWRRECTLALKGRKHTPYGELSEDGDPFVLPVESTQLEESPVPLSSGKAPLQDWQAYYQWRGFHGDSPIAVLLHFPLTLYFILTSCWPQHFPREAKALQADAPITVHIIGAEREVEMLAAFQELGHLMPDHKLNLHFVGNNISSKVDGKTLSVKNLTMTVHRCLYHQFTGNAPHLAIGFNAGLGAYQSWVPTLKKLQTLGTPTYMTDYCQYSCECSRQALIGSHLGTASDPVINPFRSPIRITCEESNLPWFGNAFIYHLIFSTLEADQKAAQPPSAVN